MVSSKPVHTAVLLLGMGLAATAAAKITCCEVNGQRVCGDPMPPQCVDKARKEFGKGGATKVIEAPLTAEQRAARAEEEARRKEEERKATEQRRKDRALLDSYTTVADIDKARERAVADIEKNAEQAQNRLDAALKKQKQLAQEKEFYAKKPLPAALQAQIKDNEAEIAAQQKAIAEKDAKVAEVNARFEADKKRYLELKGQR